MLSLSILVAPQDILRENPIQPWENIFFWGIGLNLCLCIFTKLYPHVDGLRATESVDNEDQLTLAFQYIA